MNGGTFDNFFTDFLPHIIFIIIILTGATITLLYISRFFSRLRDQAKKKKMRYLEMANLDFIENAINFIVIIAITVLILWVISLISPQFREQVWEKIIEFGLDTAIYLIIILLIALAGSRIVQLFAATAKKRPGGLFQPRTIHILELIIVWVWWLFCLFVALVIIIRRTQLLPEFEEDLGEFYRNTIGDIVALIIFIIVIFVINMFITTFLADIKKTSTRFSPQQIEMVRMSIHYFLIFLVVLVVFLSILGLSGKADLSQDILLIVAIVLGLILAMSASTSMGNALSGLVIMLSSPFVQGDMVTIGEGVQGEVKFQGIITTKVYTVEGSDVKVPNNEILKNKIINHTRSPSFPIVIDLKVGYNIEHKEVKKLLTDAVTVLEDVRDNPPPKVYTMKLGSEAVHYRLMVYTSDDRSRMEILSKVNERIIDVFHKENINIKG